MAIIIGIDPGLLHTGWGIIQFNKNCNNISLVDNGIISTNSKDTVYSRLHKIHIDLLDILKKHKVQEAAIEEIFINKNPKSSITLCYARGIILLTLKIANLSINEYSANYIKKSLTGYGHAQKEQIIFMVKQILKDNIFIKRHDTTDALATAICHAYTYNCRQECDS